MKDEPRDGVRRALESMIALESRLEESLASLLDEAEGYLEVPVVVGRLRALATGQREALRAHLRRIGTTDAPPIEASIAAAFDSSDARPGKGGTIGDLLALAGELTRAAFGYAVLHTLAHRFYQVATADLADQHRVSYLQAAQAIHQAVGDVMIQELQEIGQECRCECPACSPGICLCWHVHVEPDEAGAVPPREGVVVRQPRAQSNAERAGLLHGDVILAVEGREVRSYQDMLDRMREREPGEAVRLRVRRRTGDLQEVSVTR